MRPNCLATILAVTMSILLSPITIRIADRVSPSHTGFVIMPSRGWGVLSSTDPRDNHSELWPLTASGMKFDADLARLLRFASQNLTTIQDGVTCGAFTLDQTSMSFPFTGGGGSINVTGRSGCPYTISNLPGWITPVSGATGVGSGTFIFQVAPIQGQTHSATLNIAGSPVSITQSGIPPDFAIGPANGAPTKLTVAAGQSAEFSFWKFVQECWTRFWIQPNLADDYSSSPQVIATHHPLTPESLSSSKMISKLFFELLVPQAGSYALSTPPSMCDPGYCRIEATWKPVGEAEEALSSPWGIYSGNKRIIETSGGGKRQDGTVALAHFDGPGTLVIEVTATGMPRASSDCAGVEVRTVGWKEFVTTAEGIGFGAVIVWMFLARFLVFSLLQVTCVFFLRNFAERCLLRLPLTARSQARREIKLLLWIAKWFGVTCYAIWSIRDIVEFALRPA